jgi:hypothetical protein
VPAEVAKLRASVDDWRGKNAVLEGQVVAVTSEVKGRTTSVLLVLILRVYSAQLV